MITDALSGSAGTTTWGRDTVGRLASFGRDVAGTGSDITTTFAYNPASQIVSETRSNDAYVYAGRIAANRAYTANGLNQYAQVAGNAYCHDANGNLTADGISVYLYDIENRLVEKRTQGAGNTNCAALTYTGTLQASLRYDPMGRLYETSVGSAATTTRFLIDGDAMVAEYDSAGAMLRRYVHGALGGSDDPIAWYEGSAMNSATLRLLHANQQGSITLTGDSAGNALRIFTFDEYGVTRAGDQAALTPANGARFLYTGQALVPELGMYYYKARIYAPQLGRFMQTDPIGYKDQVNLYAYVANDPVNMTDFSGTYGRGDGFTDDQWKGFDRVQQSAASAMDRRADKLDAKADKMDAKGKAGGDGLREKAAALRAGAGFLKSDGSDGAKANMVAAADWKAQGRNEKVAARVDKIGGNQIYVNGGHGAWNGTGSDASVNFIVGHESLHSAGYKHFVGPGNVQSYRYGADATQRNLYRSITGTPAANRDPDHIMSEVYP